MKKIAPYLFIFSLITVIYSCKKTEDQPTPVPEVIPEKAVTYSDSVSFFIGNQLYVFGQKNSAGTGNRALNIKRADKTVAGGKLAYQTGGYDWYGTPDSTLYSIMYGFPSPTPGDNLHIDFIKKYKDSDLLKGAVLLQAKSNLEVFKVGKYPFAVDFGKENTLDGIILELSSNSKTFSTVIPGFSILIRSDLKTDIQDNSTFEITKVQQLEGTRYLIEAKFEVNLFDSDAKLYRAQKGFLRLATNVITTNTGIIDPR